MSEKKEASSSDDVDKKIGKLVDFFFNNKKLTFLLFIFLIGTILRFFAAINLDPNADEMVHGPHAIGIIDSGVIGRVWQSILWSYMTDLFNTFFGVTMLTSRMLSFLYGSLTIILIYLVAKEIFNERTAIIAAALMAFSSLTIIQVMMEMDLAAIFFVLFASLLFIKGLKKNGKIPISVGILIGVGALIKTLSLFFVPAFIIGYWIYHKKIFTKQHLLEILKFGLIILFVFLPIIIHNWLWYQDKQMVDAYLAQYFDVGKSREVFAGISGIGQGFKFGELSKGAWEMYSGALLKWDPVLTVLGTLGLILFTFVRREKWSYFFLLFEGFSFIFIDMSNRLLTHYVVFLPVLALYGAGLIDHMASKYKGKISYAHITWSVIVISVIISAFIFMPYISSQSGVAKARSLAIDRMEDNSIVIADSRIYRGRIAWMFNDKHYIEAALFSEMMNLNNQAGGQAQNYPVYFVECVPDDCGWGTISSQPSLNASMEQIADLFKNQTNVFATLTGGGEPSIPAGEPYFIVYKTVIPFKPDTIKAVDSTHNFFYYPIGYKPREQIIDNYNVNGAFNNLLFLLAKAIIWLSMFIALASIFYLFVLLKRDL